MAIAQNATGWTELMDANLFGAVLNMYNAAFYGWFIVIIFLVYHTMLVMKTKNYTLGFITTIFFAALYWGSTYIKTESMIFITFIIVIEFAGIIYMWYAKK